MDDIQRKVVLITGAARGIGRETALAFAKAGCKVAVGYNRSEEQANQVVGELIALGTQAAAFRADMADSFSLVKMVSEVAEQLGPIEILMTNAGINPVRPIDEVTAKDWDESIAINLSSAFHLIQAVLPEMRAQKWGRLILTSSVAAQIGGVIGPHYAASKAGMLGLAHYYAAVLAKEGITANVIAPALIETDMIKNNPAIKPTLIPVGRFGVPDEVSSVALMLAGNGYITGQTININGGWYMS
ncbi:SDR family NAD(P)-dependent oxidoreductase [Robbsia andropogonis]|nr:SDR family NAD(P)-dependent oxidoreductase [Robbsia andropogonis]